MDVKVVVLTTRAITLMSVCVEEVSSEMCQQFLTSLKYKEPPDCYTICSWVVLLHLCTRVK